MYVTHCVTCGCNAMWVVCGKEERLCNCDGWNDGMWCEKVDGSSWAMPDLAPASLPGEESSIVKLEEQLQSMMKIRFCQKEGEGRIFTGQFYGWDEMCPYGSVHQMNNLEHNLLASRSRKIPRALSNNLQSPKRTKTNHSPDQRLENSCLRPLGR